MIGIEILAAQIQQKLNRVQGLNFYIATETGDLKLPEFIDNQEIEYINGVMQSISSEITNLTAGVGKSLIYATQTCSLRLIVPIPNEEYDTFILKDGSVTSEPPQNVEDIVEYIQGYQTKLNAVRNRLQSIFQGITVEDMQDDDGKTFSVTTAYSLSEGRMREQAPMIGDSFSFYVTIYYSFVENGINSRDLTFMLDGVLLPSQLLTVFRTPTMDGNVYSNTKDGAVKNIASQSSFSATINMPSFDKDRATNYIIEYVMRGKLNQAHLLTFSINGIEESYIVTYGENRLMSEPIKNVGEYITLVECPNDYELIYFSKDYFIYQPTASNYSITPSSGAQTYVFSEGSADGFYNETTSFESSAIDYIVSTKSLTGSNIRLLQEGENPNDYSITLTPSFTAEEGVVIGEYNNIIINNGNYTPIEYPISIINGYRIVSATTNLSYVTVEIVNNYTISVTLEEGYELTQDITAVLNISVAEISVPILTISFASNVSGVVFSPSSLEILSGDIEVKVVNILNIPNNYIIENINISEEFVNDLQVTQKGNILLIAAKTSLYPLDSDKYCLISCELKDSTKYATFIPIDSENSGAITFGDQSLQLSQQDIKEGKIVSITYEISQGYELVGVGTNNTDFNLINYGSAFGIQAKSTSLILNEDITIPLYFIVNTSFTASQFGIIPIDVNRVGLTFTPETVLLTDREEDTTKLLTINESNGYKVTSYNFNSEDSSLFSIQKVSGANNKIVISRTSVSSSGGVFYLYVYANKEV